MVTGRRVLVDGPVPRPTGLRPDIGGSRAADRSCSPALTSRRSIRDPEQPGLRLLGGTLFYSDPRPAVVSDESGPQARETAFGDQVLEWVCGPGGLWPHVARGDGVAHLLGEALQPGLVARRRQGPPVGRDEEPGKPDGLRVDGRGEGGVCRPYLPAGAVEDIHSLTEVHVVLARVRAIPGRSGRQSRIPARPGRGHTDGPSAGAACGPGEWLVER